MNPSDRARAFFGRLQDDLCRELESLDGGAAFREDRWKYRAGDHPGQGGGITRVLADGEIFERGGVSFSAISGRLSEKPAAAMNVPPQRIFATAISLVLHPGTPMIPTVHMNLRYLELADGSAWFGGGADLTPYYLFEDDAAHFHRCLRAACDRHDPEYYPRFKKWCDDYFYLSHRGEARGVGGIFFDYLETDPEKTFEFVREVGQSFAGAYRPIVERRRREPWSDAEREWQLIRRGRYVEFNLVHDRGTRFGLETGGRTESILMSLPPLARWDYDHRPAPGTREAELLSVLRRPVDWVDAH